MWNNKATHLQWTTILLGAGKLSSLTLISCRKLRTHPGSCGTPWSGHNLNLYWYTSRGVSAGCKVKNKYITRNFFFAREKQVYLPFHSCSLAMLPSWKERNSAFTEISGYIGISLKLVARGFFGASPKSNMNMGFKISRQAFAVYPKN